MLNILVVLVFLRVDLSLQQNILPEHMTSHCGAINSAEIMEDILPAVRTLIKDNMEDLWRRYEEKLATMKGDTFWTCPQGWVHYNKYCYLFRHTTGSWFTAKAYCESEYASLAEIKNVQENDFIVRTIRNIDLPGVSLASRSYYVGGTDHAKEGEWIWAGSKDRMTFDNFQPPEPNNKANNEHCLSLYGPIHFSWNDDGCKHGYYSICKASASRVFKG
ncbi:perlucin-like protein isoform X2 [Argopecten irradians]|uniref:perlucin-like protein isoform X2 n=1 Tax=Argopecten irradians TaxID=31199 RepID=UPI003724AF63